MFYCGGWGYIPNQDKDRLSSTIRSARGFKLKPCLNVAFSIHNSFFIWLLLHCFLIYRLMKSKRRLIYVFKNHALPYQKKKLNINSSQFMFIFYLWQDKSGKKRLLIETKTRLQSISSTIEQLHPTHQCQKQSGVFSSIVNTHSIITLLPYLQWFSQSTTTLVSELRLHNCSHRLGSIRTRPQGLVLTKHAGVRLLIR